MNRALALARRGLGRVEPNPMVGCVVVRGGRVIGEGHHRRFGGPHAEVEALRDCTKRGHSARGADVYVTLEPCCHYGKTPPCTDALIAARPRRVIAAMIDPFPRVAGGGVAALRRAGIEVEVGLCEEEARRLNEAFIKRNATGLPWVIVKWAQSLDGRIAAADGDSRWISNDQSRQHVHRLRARVDAVIVGVGTAIADDPQLTARGVPILRAARRVVVDPDLRIPEGARLFRVQGSGFRVEERHGRRLLRSEIRNPKSEIPPVTLAVRASLLARRPPKLKRLEVRGVEFVGLPARPGHPKELDLKPLLAHLASAHGATRVLAEGGGTLTGHLFKQDLLDEVLAFIAPRILGDEGLPAVRGLPVHKMDQARDLSVRAVQRFGDDMLVSFVRKHQRD